MRALSLLSPLTNIPIQPTYLAAENGEVDLVRELLECGVVQPNATDQVFHLYSSASAIGNKPIEEGSVY